MDFLLHEPGGSTHGTRWREPGPAGSGDVHSLSGGQRAGGAGGAGRGGRGLRAYLSEPVSAFSVANYRGTAFRRAHTHTSSSRCAASCGKRRRQVAAALAGQEALPRAGDRRKEVREWEPELGTVETDCLKAPLPYGPLQGRPCSWSRG